MNNELSDKIETHEIVKRGLFVAYRGQKALDRLKSERDIDVISITADYDFRNILNPFNNEYRIVYKNKY